VIVVFDTNIWVSALEFGGNADAALARALMEDQVAISPFIEAEIVRILTRKLATRICLA